MVQLKSVLGSAVASLPAPTVLLQPWLDVAAQCPMQWKQFVKRSLPKTVEAHQVQLQLGIRTIVDNFDAPLEELLDCPVCPRESVPDKSET